MWPLWLRLPWFSAARPRAAPRSTLPLVSPALLGRSTTTVSPAPVFSRRFGRASASSGGAGKARVHGVRLSADTLMCSCCSALGQCLFPGACLPCNKGFYQPLSGQQQCWPCNRGYYTKYTHTHTLCPTIYSRWWLQLFCLLHLSDCVYSITGSPLCNPCPAGSFNNNTGAVGCASCSPGAFTPRRQPKLLQSVSFASRRKPVRRFWSALRFPFIPSEFHLVCAVCTGNLLQVSWLRLESSVTRTPEWWRRGGGWGGGARSWPDITCLHGCLPAEWQQHTRPHRSVSRRHGSDWIPLDWVCSDGAANLNSRWRRRVFWSCEKNFPHRAGFFASRSSSGCSQCQTCPGGREALQTAAKDCTPCRPGHSHCAEHQLQ